MLSMLDRMTTFAHWLMITNRRWGQYLGWGWEDALDMVRRTRVGTSHLRDLSSWRSLARRVRGWGQSWHWDSCGGGTRGAGAGAGSVWWYPGPALGPGAEEWAARRMPAETRDPEAACHGPRAEQRTWIVSIIGDFATLGQSYLNHFDCSKGLNLLSYILTCNCLQRFHMGFFAWGSLSSLLWHSWDRRRRRAGGWWRRGRPRCSSRRRAPWWTPACGAGTGGSRSGPRPGWR